MKIINITVPLSYNSLDSALVKIFLLLIFFVQSQSIRGQDAIENRRNTIKLDLTSNLLFRNALNFSYERVRRPNQTYAITVGYQEFPKLTSIGTGIVTTDDSKKRTGFKVGGEYRFYLKKENKYQAPHGVYIGPYASYLNFNNERDLRITADNGTVQLTLFSNQISTYSILVFRLAISLSSTTAFRLTLPLSALVFPAIQPNSGWMATLTLMRNMNIKTIF